AASAASVSRANMVRTAPNVFMVDPHFMVSVPASPGRPCGCSAEWSRRQYVPVDKRHQSHYCAPPYRQRLTFSRGFMSTLHIVIVPVIAALIALPTFAQTSDTGPVPFQQVTNPAERARS